MDSEKTEKKPWSKPLPKKKYSKPVLNVYGDLSEITRNVGIAGANDGVLVLKTH